VTPLEAELHKFVRNFVTTCITTAIVLFCINQLDQHSHLLFRHEASLRRMVGRRPPL
jgi:hypothetical protein